MPALSWATKEQTAWLIEYQQKYYLPLMAKRNYTSFWNPFFEAFAIKWPERERLFPDTPDEGLAPEQKEALVGAIKDRKNKLTNWMRVHSRPKKPVMEDSGKLPDLLADEQEGRNLAPMEVFSKLYYKSHVKPLINEGEEDKVPVHVIRKATSTAWQDMKENEPEKAQSVMEECERRREEREKELAEHQDESPTTDQIASAIRRAPTLLINALQRLQKSTNLSFTLLFGGPDPDMGGALRSGCIHLGETDVGANFADSYLDYDERVMKPYSKFLTRVYPTAPDGSAAPSLRTNHHDSRTATPAAPGSYRVTPARGTGGSCPPAPGPMPDAENPSMGVPMPSEYSALVTPMPGVRVEDSTMMVPAPSAECSEHSDTTTTVPSMTVDVGSSYASLSRMPALLATPSQSSHNSMSIIRSNDSTPRMLGVPNASEPSLMTYPTPSPTPPSVTPAPNLSLPKDLLPSCGLTLSNPVSDTAQQSPWALKPDVPFSFHELYHPLPSSITSDPSLVSPFTWAHPNTIAQYHPFVSSSKEIPAGMHAANHSLNFMGESAVHGTTGTEGTSWKRVNSENANNSLDADYGRGKRVRIASKRAEEANAIGDSSWNNGDAVSDTCAE